MHETTCKFISLAMKLEMRTIKLEMGNSRGEKKELKVSAGFSRLPADERIFGTILQGGTLNASNDKQVLVTCIRLYLIILFIYLKYSKGLKRNNRISFRINYNNK